LNIRVLEEKEKKGLNYQVEFEIKLESLIF